MWTNQARSSSDCWFLTCCKPARSKQFHSLISSIQLDINLSSWIPELALPRMISIHLIATLLLLLLSFECNIWRLLCNHYYCNYSVPVRTRNGKFLENWSPRLAKTHSKSSSYFEISRKKTIYIYTKYWDIRVLLKLTKLCVSIKDFSPCLALPFIL